MSDIEPHLAHIPRWFAAACGGIATSAAQFVGQSQAPKLAGYVVRWELSNMGILFLTFIIGTAFFMLLGSLAGVFSSEESRAKLFWLGVGAPALFAVALPAAGSLIDKTKLSGLVAPAYAAESSVAPCPDYRQLTLSKSLKSFFGLDNPQYRVVVGSFKSDVDASLLAKQINDGTPSLKASVVGKAPCNDHYAVTVGDGAYFSLEKAKSLQSHALEVEGVTGAYLSPER
jgi:hypothetical protein